MASISLGYGWLITQKLYSTRASRKFGNPRKLVGLLVAGAPADADRETPVTVPLVIASSFSEFAVLHQCGCRSIVLGPATYEQYRYRSGSQHHLGIAAEHEPIQTPPSMRAHYDQVCRPFPSRRQDEFGNPAGGFD